MDSKTKGLITDDQKNKTNKQWDGLFDEASQQIMKYFKNPTSEDMPKVKVATSVLSSFTRHEQTQSAREQTSVMIARHISENKEEFAEYLRLSNPNLKLLAES